MFWHCIDKNLSRQIKEAVVYLFIYLFKGRSARETSKSDINSNTCKHEFNKTKL